MSPSPQDDSSHPDDMHPEDPHPDDMHPDDMHPVLPGQDMVEQDAQARPARRRRSRLTPWVTLLSGLVFLVAGGYFALQNLDGVLPTVDLDTETAADYPGPGSGEVVIEIPEGAGGSAIAQILEEEDVVASAAAFSSLARADTRAATIQPGSYTMRSQMSADGALERLLDPAARNNVSVTVPEGLWASEIFGLLAEATGNEVAEYEAVTPAELGLPKAAGDTLEGYLFPDTYSFAPDETPQQQLQEMVDLREQRFAEAGIEGQVTRDVLIKASLIAAEASESEDLPKVAQVIENRIAKGMPLGFDSTIHYMFQERGRASTTDAQRATESPYNTYLNPGLPPAPINNPGLAAIEAALNPEQGPWLYFVTVNPSTGETNFARTFEEHQENVALFQQWCRDNPDSC